MDIRLEQITTIPIMGRSLIAHDPRSRAHPVRGTVVDPEIPRKSRIWRRGTAAYDQGATSSCVGQTFKGILNTAPHLSLVKPEIRLKYDAYGFYHGGQGFDEWPGSEPTYYGTSALGVCKHLQQLNVIKEYRWCFGIDDVIDTLCQHGPVAIGIMFTRDMMRTDANGFLVPGGRYVGGHEMELRGVNVEHKYVYGTNSWGPDWGINGHYKIDWTTLDLLLQDDGDAVTVVEVVAA